MTISFTRGIRIQKSRHSSSGPRVGGQAASLQTSGDFNLSFFVSFLSSCCLFIWFASVLSSRFSCFSCFLPNPVVSICLFVYLSYYFLSFLLLSGSFSISCMLHSFFLPCFCLFVHSFFLYFIAFFLAHFVLFYFFSIPWLMSSLLPLPNLFAAFLIA